MNKVPFDIPRKEDGKWGSYISKYPADSGKVPPNSFTTDSRNVITSSTGMAEKRLGGAIWNASSLLSGAALDQYEGIFASGQRLLIVNDAGTLKASTGTGLFTSITAGYTNPANFEFVTYQGRVYGCNGVDSPICLDTVTSYGGVSYVFTTAKTKVMGAQAPSSAPTATRNTDSTASQVPAGSHRYKITYTYYNGVEESNGSAASAVCVNDATHTSNALTAIPVGGYGCTARNVYRDDNNGVYLLLDTIANNTATTYTDILPIGSTPTPMPTANNVPGVFKYCALNLDRIFVIDITGKNISWSNAGQPDIFDPANVISGPQDDVMTAIYVFNGRPYVFGQHTVGTIEGTTDGTFYYSPLSTTVGCVDNRSIQTRSIVSVPTLLWLAATPNKGIYYTNGSIVQYLSDFIEDLTFNLAQISYLSRQNTQASQAAFQSGTASTGIDLTSNPGTIQTIDPQQEFSHAADWAAGVLSNIAVSGDALMVPIGKAYTLGAGAVGGSAIISGSNVTFTPGGNFTGETLSSAGSSPNNAGPAANSDNAEAQAIIPTYSGTLGDFAITFTWQNNPNTSHPTGSLNIYNDAGGTPGSALSTQTFTLNQVGGATSTATITKTFNFALTGGTKYWLVAVLDNTAGANTFFGPINYTSGSWTGGAPSLGRNGGGVWNALRDQSNNGPYTIAASYTFTKTAVPMSGSWTSSVYDSLCTTETSGMALAISASYVTHTSASVLVQGSPDQSAWTTTDTLSSPNGTTSLTGGQYRYWRVVTNIATTDDRVVPTVAAPTLTFNTTGTWTSAAILCTADITALTSLVSNTLLPSGTTVTLTIATSADNISYSSFTAIGSATPRKWAKIKVTLTTDSGNTVSSTLLTAELDWTVTSNLISSAIDTGANPPSGWGIFQFNRVGVGGTVSFFFRSASTALGLAGASFTAVTNGGFPVSSALEFCQWKVVMVATADSIPQVDSVTVNWLLTSGTNVRAASLFFNKSYYLSVATTGSTTNNLLIELDYEGNWRDS
jgi:hypothetical protein